MWASNLNLDEPTLISVVFDGTCPSIFGKRYLRIARRASNQFLPSLSPASCYLALYSIPIFFLKQIVFTVQCSNVRVHIALQIKSTYATF